MANTIIVSVCKMKPNLSDRLPQNWLTLYSVRITCFDNVIITLKWRRENHNQLTSFKYYEQRPWLAQFRKKKKKSSDIETMIFSFFVQSKIRCSRSIERSTKPSNFWIHWSVHYKMTDNFSFSPLDLWEPDKTYNLCRQFKKQLIVKQYKLFRCSFSFKSSVRLLL